MGYACGGQGGTWEISALSFQFCGEPENAPKKIKSLLKKEEEDGNIALIPQFSTVEVY